MLTPNEVRARLEEIAGAVATEQHAWALHALVGLLGETYPELVALSSGRSHEDAGRRYRDEVGGD